MYSLCLPSAFLCLPLILVRVVSKVVFVFAEYFLFVSQIYSLCCVKCILCFSQMYFAIYIFVFCQM